MSVEIFIVGRDFLGNELLCHFLNEKFPGYRLKTLVHLDNFYHSLEEDAAETTLLLCDCKSYPPEYFLNRLQIYFLRHSFKTRSLFYNLQQDVQLENRLLKSGIQGIVHADAEPATLLKAIKKVLEGQLWASRQVMNQCLPTEAGGSIKTVETAPQRLTPRECQILRMISDGSSNESIAENLCISRHTVKTHLYNIFRKINVSNRMKAAKWAEQHLPSSW